MSSTAIDLDRLLKLRVAVARVGEGELAGWWNSKVLNRRFDPATRDRPLVQLAQADLPLDTWRPLLLWHITRDEFLLRDFLESWRFAAYEEGAFRLRPEQLTGYLAGLRKRDAIAHHYTDIFDLYRLYRETPNKPHEGIAIWISGFFGSGKSSFAKMLDLALANCTIAGEPASSPAIRPAKSTASRASVTSPRPT